MHPLLGSVVEKQELVTTLYGGTLAMREAGTDYLPQEPGEEDINYKNRLARSVLFPAYKQAVKANTGKLYTKEVVVHAATKEMSKFLESVDEQENDLTEFAKLATDNAINNGCSYILIDYPVMSTSATRADEQAAGGRPYWVNIKQTQVLEASPIKRAGKNVLGVFRYVEQVPFRSDPFTVKYIEQIKQFDFDDDEGFVQYTTYQKDKKNNWVVVDTGKLIFNNKPFTEIPIVAINVEPVGFYVGQPVFYDLAEENKQHWQMASDYNNIVHNSQVPMVIATGVGSSVNPETGNASDPFIISPNTVAEYSSKDTKVFWLEVTGDAAAVGEKSLSSSLRRMSVMSLQLMVNVDTNATATASMIDAKESLSVLQSIGKAVEQALDKAINFTYKYNGIENETTTVEINTDDAVIFGDANDGTTLLSMVEIGLLTKETGLEEFKRRGILSPKLDVQKEAAAATLALPVEPATE